MFCFGLECVTSLDGIHVINENEEIDTTVLYSPMNYCYSVLNYEQNSVKALHFYNYFAVMYAGEN